MYGFLGKSWCWVLLKVWEAHYVLSWERRLLFPPQPRGVLGTREL